MNYYKHIISKAISYTFNRMTLYITIFNFCILCFWIFDNTEIGEWLKNEGYRAGDLISVVIFSLFAISVLEYILIGRNKNEVE